MLIVDVVTVPSLVSAGHEQYYTGHDENDAAPESCAHAAPRNHPVSRLQLTHYSTGHSHHWLPSSALAISGPLTRGQFVLEAEMQYTINSNMHNSIYCCVIASVWISQENIKQGANSNVTNASLWLLLDHGTLCWHRGEVKISTQIRHTTRTDEVTMEH